MELLTTAEVAAEYRIAEQTLHNWRWQGKGPRYRKAGSKVLYRRTDVEAWLDSSVPSAPHVAAV